jgi:hypothetical protein
MVIQNFDQFELNKKNSVSEKTKEQVVNGENISEVTWKDAISLVSNYTLLKNTLLWIMFLRFHSMFLFAFVLIMISITINATIKQEVNNVVKILSTRSTAFAASFHVTSLIFSPFTTCSFVFSLTLFFLFNF